MLINYSLVTLVEAQATGLVLIGVIDLMVSSYARIVGTSDRCPTVDRLRMPYGFVWGKTRILAILPADPNHRVSIGYPEVVLCGYGFRYAYFQFRR